MEFELPSYCNGNWFWFSLQILELQYLEVNRNLEFMAMIV